MGQVTKILPWRNYVLGAHTPNEVVSGKYSMYDPLKVTPRRLSVWLSIKTLQTWTGTTYLVKRALRIVFPNCHYDDALIQFGITALSQRREEACINFIKRDCLSSPVIKSLIPCVSIDRPYCLRSRRTCSGAPKTKRFADFCTIKFQDQL